jgi:hypothetical protein
MGNQIGNDFIAAHPEELNENGTVRVCVGGGSGFIGSHLAKRLKEFVNFTRVCSFFHFLFYRVAMLSAQIGKITNL